MMCCGVLAEMLRQDTRKLACLQGRNKEAARGVIMKGCNEKGAGGH